MARPSPLETPWWARGTVPGARRAPTAPRWSLVRPLQEAFEDDRLRQLNELRFQIQRRYGQNAYDSFMAYLWWGWEFRIGPALPWVDR